MTKGKTDAELMRMAAMQLGHCLDKHRQTPGSRIEAIALSAALIIRADEIDGRWPKRLWRKLFHDYPKGNEHDIRLQQA